jgi:hypothetical protein
MAVALTLLLVVGLVGCAALVAGSRGAGEEDGGSGNQQGGAVNTSATANGDKQEAPEQGSLDTLIPEQVGDFTLQTNQPLKSKPKSSTESRQLTYKSSDDMQINHVVGFVAPAYVNNEEFVSGFFESGEKGIKQDLGGEPERSEFLVEDENGKQVGRGVFLAGTQNDALFWTNGRLTAVVKAPTGHAQDFYDELTY